MPLISRLSGELVVGTRRHETVFGSAIDGVLWLSKAVVDSLNRTAINFISVVGPATKTKSLAASIDFNRRSRHSVSPNIQIGRWVLERRSRPTPKHVPTLGGEFATPTVCTTLYVVMQLTVNSWLFKVEVASLNGVAIVFTSVVGPASKTESQAHHSKPKAARGGWNVQRGECRDTEITRSYR